LGYYETAKQSPMMMLPKDTRTLNLRHTLEIYNSSKENATNNLVISMNTTLSEIAKSKQQIALQKSLISNLEKNLLNANNKYKYGLISKSQLSQLELRKKIADIELKKLNINHISLYEQLSKLVGEKVAYDTEITGNLIIDVAELKSLDYYIDYALSNKKDIRISYNNSLFREIEYQIAIQNYGIESKSESFRTSYITYSNAVNSYEDSKLNVRLQIINTYSENEQQMINLARAQNNFELAQSNYKQAQQKHSIGQITDYDLASKNIDMIKSQSELFNAKRNAYISRLKLNQACGIIIQ
jgi:outer membrane protein TolC